VTTARPAPRRAPRLLASAFAAVFAGIFAVALLAACSSEGADTNCSLNACTVTFDRGTNASVNILGVEAKLVGAEDETVTLEVAGEQVQLTTGQAATEVGGMKVTLESADAEQIVVEIAR
jgi:hypothetical protein